MVEPVFDFNKFLRRKNYKQKDAATAVGASMGLIGTWAAKKAVPSYEKIAKLINLGISAQELFGENLGAKLIQNSAPHAQDDAHHKNHEPIDYKSPEFQAIVEKAMLDIEARKKTGRV